MRSTRKVNLVKRLREAAYDFQMEYDAGAPVNMVHELLREAADVIEDQDNELIEMADVEDCERTARER